MTVEEIRQKILAEMAKTERLIAEYREMTAPVSPDSAIGRLSRMDAINNKAVTEAAQRQAEQKLSRLQYVLSRAGSPDFGVCVQCGSPIALGRILLRPESVHCVKCAQ